MGLLPDIEGGKLVETVEKKPYRPPSPYKSPSAEEQLFELNNLGHRKVSEDFSDSPHLNK